MPKNHLKYWPKKIPTTLTVPETPLYDNLVVSARRYPHKTAIDYYGATLTYHQLWTQAESFAAYLQHQLNLKNGDRVLLYMQNTPQFVVAFHGVLRAGGVVVPLNPMNLTEELRFYIEDSDACVAVVGQELYERIAPLMSETGLRHIVVAAYSDYLSDHPDASLPDFVRAPRQTFTHTNTVLWTQAIPTSGTMGTTDPSGPSVAPVETTVEDLAVLPYTSGTTGVPKGCMHPHRTVQANTVGACTWFGTTADGVILAALPFFHVTGMVHGMLAPIYSGATMVLMTRWNRDTAGRLIERTHVTHWTNIATMVVDFLANPNLEAYDLSSLMVVGGGGAALPEAVGEKLYEKTGIRYAEGYGLSETIAQTHFNPIDRPILQCMGIPSFDVDARIVNPTTLEELGTNEEGEVIVHGPQVFNGYWKRSDENTTAFIEIEGKQFFRTGDIARYDEDGYFFMVDRVKRMINAAGFKVWPSEVESTLYKHPAVEQACVIGVADPRRGETVKAYIVLSAGSKGSVGAEDIMAWSHERMAAYKVPREIAFVDQLPMSGSGKILWRQLQADEQKQQGQAK
ncbi:MAG: long-chain fatty acid--CoA ligase [Alicyclobacillus sp. RIFOXYA1_FULL_53_8]|nr:MAG: long-chain fatty acid--CoA ligase [Alicyclobacillus sp. RIFOXYA1_FULL_53_8]